MIVLPGDEFYAVLLRVRGRSLDVVDMTSDRPTLCAVAQAIADEYERDNPQPPAPPRLRLVSGGAQDSTTDTPADSFRPRLRLVSVEDTNR